MDVLTKNYNIADATQAPESVKKIDQSRSMTDSLHCSSLVTTNQNFNISQLGNSSSLGASTVFSQSGELNLNMFEVGKFLGGGGFGKVYLARLRGFPFVCALKVIYKNRLVKENTSSWKQIRREIDLQKGMYHKNIIRLYGWFYDENRLFLVQEYAPKSSLYDLITENGPFDALTAGRVIWDIAQALRFLHNRQIIHRDIKAENVLLTENCAKLADFGWSIHSPKIQVNRTNNRYQVAEGVARRNTLCGTMDYYSPEMVTLCCGEKASYDTGIDIWALGVLLYELITKVTPFFDTEVQTTLRNIFNLDINYVEFPSCIPLDAQDLIRSMLNKDITKRIKIGQVLNHPFMIKCSKVQSIDALFKSRRISEASEIAPPPLPKDSFDGQKQINVEEMSDLLSEDDC